MLAVPATAEREEDSSPRLALGLSLVSVGDRETLSAVEGGPGTVFARIRVEWSEVETRVGEYDWSAYEDDIAALHTAGARLMLSLAGTHPEHVPSGGPPSPLEGRSLDAWLAFVRSASRRFAGRIDALEIWDRGGRGNGTDGAPRYDDPRTYAFVLKSSALAARAEVRARGAALRIAQAAVAPADLEWQRELWAQDAAAYIDILPLTVELDSVDTGLDATLREFLAENLRHPPAAELWARLAPRDEADPWVAVEGAVRALAAGVPVALVDLAGPAAKRAEVARWVVVAHRRLAAGFAPAPLGRIGFSDAEGRSMPEAAALGAFLDDRFTTLIFYRAPGETSEFPQERMLLGPSPLRNVRWLDPLTGRELRVGSTALDTGQRAIPILSGDYPTAVLFERPTGSAGFELPSEEIETTGERELTAEEIIARYQQVQKVQDDALDRWMARGRIDYHFRFIQGGSTIDVSIDTQYFWERGAELEWEEIDYYINGNLVPWKRFPKIPLLQPEKVITLPLDLTLDKTYAYRRVGRDRIGGREAYVLEFSPQDPDAATALYRGRVWIDATEFYRVKASLVQTDLEAPILSNEEIDRYALQTDDAGTAFWLLGKIEGQQVWSTAGRNFVVQREVTFVEYDINPTREAFENRRAEAYASNNNMMRDTKQGFRYLDKQADGTRVLKPPAKSQWFAALGAFEDSSTDGVQPLAGANYFNFDVGGKNIQINALMGGVVNFFTASKPDLAGGRVSATADVFLPFIYFDDQVFFGDQELTEQRVDQRIPRIDFRLGVQAAQFVKFDFIAGVTYREYQDSEKGTEAIAEYNLGNPGQSLTFVLPSDHFELGGAVALNYNRRGYSLIATTAVVRRSDWEQWGLFDESGNTYVGYDPLTGVYEPADPPALEDRFVKWGVTGFKEWFLPKFQKVRGEINYLGGADLDRFSKYQFSLFGDDRLNGFSGTGVRFDEGVIARAGYSFNLFEVIRLDAGLERAWVRDESAPGATRQFTGLGLSGNIVGPWKTVISASYGRAIDSDIPDLENSDEFFLLILKLF